MFDERPLSRRPKRANSGRDHFRGRSCSAFVAAVPAGDSELLDASVNWLPKCDVKQAMEPCTPGFQACLSSLLRIGIIRFDTISTACFSWIEIARQDRLNPASTANGC